MKPQNLILLLVVFLFHNLIYSQFSISVDYNDNKNIIINNISNIATNSALKTNYIAYSNSKSKNYIESFFGVKNEAYKMPSINRLVTNATNKTYDWAKYNMTRNRTWDNPYGVNTFTEAIVRGTVNAVIKIIKKNI